MFRRSLNLTDCGCAALVMLIVLNSPCARASEKKELLKQAQAAEATHDFAAAETAYCDLSSLDSRNKTAKAKCAYYRGAHETFAQGLAAYRKNDFETARKLFLQASAGHAGAVEYITKVDQYTAHFNAGFRLARRGETTQAIEEYRRAQKIKPDGPWDLNSKIATLEQQLSSTTEPEPLSTDDQVLVEAMTEFYRASYVNAEKMLATYKGEGKRKALALFYLGASELSRYHLSASREADKALYRSALSHFVAAKQAASDFVPPEKYVSPMVLKTYAESTR